jgi:hypothetical protein
MHRFEADAKNALEQGQIDRSEATTPAQPRLVDTHQTSDAGQEA